jgi:hypothetical protein
MSSSHTHPPSTYVDVGCENTTRGSFIHTLTAGTAASGICSDYEGQHTLSYCVTTHV